MKKNHKTFIHRPRTLRIGLLASLAGILVAAGPLGAQVTFKANNQDSLDLPSSWVDGLLPDGFTTAVWDSTVTGANSVSFSEALAWGGIQILNPGGAVGISGAGLTIGPDGIDMSQATQDLTISSGLSWGGPQKIQVGPGRTLRLPAEVPGRPIVAGLDFRIDETAEVFMAGGGTDFIQAGSQIYATYNGLEFAAVNFYTPFQVIPTSGDAFLVSEYVTPNPGPDPEDPDGIPTILDGGENYYMIMDFVDDSTAGVRTSGGNGGIYNLRFNEPNTNHEEWVALTSASGHTLSMSSILVTENVGPQNVRIGGPGWTRIHGTGGGLMVFQNNPQGDLILSPGQTLSEQGGGRSLSKMGVGRLIIDGITAYTGPTYVHEGILQFNQPMASGNQVTVADGGALHLTGSSMNISQLNLRPGSSLAGRGRITGGVENRGDVLVTGTANRLLLTGNVVNYGTIVVEDEGYLEIDGTFTNFGVLDYSGGYATLPEGWVNEGGTVIEGQDGPPPSALGDLRVSQIVEEDGQIQISLSSIVGYNYSLERSFTLQSPVLEPTQVTTEDGNGADTFLSNDGQGGHDPDANHGANGSIVVRNYDEVRQKVGLVRFDLSQLEGDHVFDEAVFSVHAVGSNRNRTFELWGVTDESLDDWIEVTVPPVLDENENVIEEGIEGVTYNNFDGVLEAPLGSKILNEEVLTHLGNFPVAGAGVTYTTNPEAVPLGDFLRSSTNGVVTFMFFMTGTDSNASYTFASKENPTLGTVNPLTGDTVIPPTLTIPSEAYVQERELFDPWIPVGAAQSGTDEILTFVDEMPEADRAFYRVVAEQ